MKLFPLLAKTILDLRVGDVEINEKDSDKDGNGHGQDEETLKHKGAKPIRQKPVFQQLPA
jgi:hypothetical protein